MTSFDGKTLEITEFGPLVATADGSLTIRHAGHGQDFHSAEGAKFEAWNLYVVTSGFEKALKAPSKQNLIVLDVGMGLGYNAAATIAAWMESPGQTSVEMFSLEIDARLVQVVASGSAPWQAGWSESWVIGPRSLFSQGSSYAAELTHPRSGKLLKWVVVVGDADQADLSRIRGAVDYIWQDPFTPELNPKMWSREWFERLKKLASPECSMVSYSVARAVKQALEEAGWRYERVPTPGRKRHWLKASL